MDPITVTQAVASGHHLLSIFKTITSGLKDLGRIDMANQVMELQVETLDLLQKQQELVIENRALKEEIAQLKRLGALRFEHNAYWLPREDGSGLDGPFSRFSCDRRKTLVRLSFRAAVRDKLAFYCDETQESVHVPFSFLTANNVCSPEQIRTYFPKDYQSS